MMRQHSKSSIDGAATNKTTKMNRIVELNHDEDDSDEEEEIPKRS